MRSALTSLLTIALVLSGLPLELLRVSGVRVSTVASAATLPFLQSVGHRSGPVGFNNAQSFDVPTPRSPGKAELIVIVLRDDFRPGQAIVSVTDSRSGARYTPVALTPLTNGLTVGAFTKVATAADGGEAIVSLAAPTGFPQFAWAVASSFVVQDGGDFDAATTSVQSPGGLTFTQPDFTPAADDELLVSMAGFIAPATGTFANSPSGQDPVFFTLGGISPSFGPIPGFTISFARGARGRAIGSRTIRASDTVSQAAVLVFGIKPAAPPTPSDEVADELGASFGADPTVGLQIAEPVNTFTGNLSLSSIDLAIPGRGPPLRLARSYNARDPRAGIFGPGWSSDLGWSVRERSSGDVVLFRPDGRRDVFHRNADGTYAPPSGVFDQLTRREGGGFTLRTVDQRTLLFASDGVLTSLADRSGNTLSYSFAAGGQRVAEIAAPGGRSLSFEYDADGHLVRGSDSAGRAVAYAYAGGRLAAVTDPTGAVTRYAYDASGRLATITDPLGNVMLTNTYDADGRVVAQRDALGGTTAFAYGADRVTTTTGPRGATTRIAHDAAGRATALTDATGRTVSYTYDARGSLSGFTDRSGNTWSFAHDARGNRTGVIDPVSASASFTYDARNDLLTRSDPLGNTWRYAYDARGNLVRVTDPEGGVTAIEVDAHGQPTTVTDADGVAVAYAYDAAGDVTSVTAALGTSTTVYDAAGRPVRRTDPNGHATSFTYDPAGRVTGTTDPLGQASALTYDTAGNLTQTIDRRGSRTAFAYDAVGRLVRITDALGGITSFAYDAAGNRTRIVDPSAKATTFTYDPLERLASVTDPEGGVSRLGYDQNGNLVQTTDPRGGIARNTYNFRNQRERAVDRAGTVTTFAYDASGRLVGTTDPAGATTRFAYDRAGRYTSTTDAAGGITALAYTATGRLAARIDPRGHRTGFAYDASGRLVSLTDALGGVTRYAYDAAGNRTARGDALGRVTRSAYDAADRLASLTDATGTVTRFAYDAEGVLTVLTDALGAATRYASDPLGRLVQVTDALGGITRYELDPRGLLARLVDANGNARSYAYDGARRLVREADGLGRARTYAYDLSGNLVLATDPKGQATRYAYDAEDRLVEIARADGELVRYTRDARGLRTAMTDPRGATAYTYDALRRLTSVTDPAGRRVGYAYDASGNRARLDYPDGRAAEYAYDALDRLTSVAFAGGVQRYTYDAVGNAVAAAFANGTRLSASYDLLDRPTALTHLDARGRLAAAFVYGYDAVGNVITERAEGARDLRDERAYSYDPLRRLVSVTDREKKTTAFRYDPVGNRTLVGRGDDVDDAHALRAAYDAADQLISLVRSKDGKLRETFSYDTNGNLVERTRGDDVATFAYDAADRLVALINREADDGEARERRFTYDGDGLLVREERSRPGRAGDGDRARTLEHTLDVAGPLAQALTTSDGKGAASYLYGLSRLAAFGPKETRFFAADVRGSPRLLTDARGQVAGVRSFDAWGVPDSDGAVSNEQGPAALAELFGFTGERQDSRSGFLYLRARWYEPSLGRFLTRDPVAGARSDPRTQHPYMYGLDNPTSFVDRTGRSAAGLFDGQSRYSYDGTQLYGDPWSGQRPWITPPPPPARSPEPPPTPLPQPGPRPIPAPPGPSFAPDWLGTTSTVIGATTLVYDTAEGLRQRASAIGRQMHAPLAAIRSQAAGTLTEAGKLSSYAKSPLFKAAGRVLLPLGFAIDFVERREQGAGVVESFVYAGAKTAGAVGGAVVGGLACAPLAASVVGIVACPVLIAGFAYGGGEFAGTAVDVARPFLRGLP